MPVLLDQVKGETHMRYEVRCPAHAYENSSTDDLDQAYLWALDLSEEYETYAEVGYYNVKGHYQLLADYNNGK